MSEVENPAEAAAADRWRWKRGWGMTAIVICSATDLFVALDVIPRGGMLLHDLLEDDQLPAVSRLVLDSRWGFVAFVCFWPLAAVWIRRRPRATLYVAAILVITLAQALFAGIAIMVPINHMLHLMGGAR
jgi:hypothetical protein